MKTTLDGIWRTGVVALAVLSSNIGMGGTAYALDDKPAKELFGAALLPNANASSPYGSYAKGCQSGAVALPKDGPGWQAMRPSRNRNWGQPQLIALLEQFSQDAQKIGWPGLLVGDISQPRGGPMLSGHASHQIGLDADIWFTPMPNRVMTPQERDNLPFTSMLDKNKFLTVNPHRWTSTHARLVMQAASYPQVDRVFVNPAIKKKLCETWSGDRSDMGKIRPIYGHDEHFHIRIKCPASAAGCKPQAAVPAGDGCDKSLAWWFTKEPWAPPKKDPDAKPVKPRPMMLSDLPKACSSVLAAPSIASVNSALPSAYSAPSQPSSQIEAIISQDAVSGSAPAGVPIPLARPVN